MCECLESEQNKLVHIHVHGTKIVIYILKPLRKDYILEQYNYFMSTCHMSILLMQHTS